VDCIEEIVRGVEALCRPYNTLPKLGEMKSMPGPARHPDADHLRDAEGESHVQPRKGRRRPAIKTLLRSSVFATLTLLPCPATAATEHFVVIIGEKNVGHLKADLQDQRITIDFDFKNNGRGPTLVESITTDPSGIPTTWSITGTTTFGSKVNERFTVTGNTATWTDPVGTGSATLKEPNIYVAQGASPWAFGLYARALLKDADQRMPALPSGTLRLVQGDAVTVSGAAGQLRVTSYALTGINLSPDYLLLDGQDSLFAYITPDFVIVRQGYESEDKRLRALAAKMSTDHYAGIEKEVAHRYGLPIRIRNVRLFDPSTGALTEPQAVVVSGRHIAAVEPLDSPATAGEVTVDGAGGTLVPGMYEMHGHLSQDDALLNLAAGITSVRDMGNNNAVLDDLIARIDSGAIGGPRVVRSGFIEGRSPFNANYGIVVDSESAAIDAVRWYAARGYWQIKVYNSMNPAWVPAIVTEAHRLGMRVAGHVPAFSNANAMIEAGYDEVTHINQFMLGWVLKPGEDTRTLLRLTALRRLQDLDLDVADVVRTLDLMVSRKVAIDPTLNIHEALTQNRDGQTPPGAVDYLDHMPIGYQRSAKKAMTDTSAPGDDQAYRDAFEKIVATVKALHERRVLIVMGTDTGGSFTFHRELELYQRAGMTAPEILTRATLDMARYLGQDQQLGSIEKGKLADFFLVPGDPTADLKAIKAIRMVVKDGTVYFPSEVYPKFGITPFVDPPRVTGAPSTTTH
jgi:imidazolonepropionase-like amidohydrolase